MKRFLLILLLFLVTLSPALSQKVFFVYIQTESNQPFFISLNEKIHSSSSSGYLLLSQLKDSSYRFTVGFPRNKYPEQQFSIDINGKDRGYLLKDFGADGWGLYDLQTASVIMGKPGQRQPIPQQAGAAGEASMFTQLLALAANDPSLQEKAVLAKKIAPASAPHTVAAETVKEPVKEAPLVRDSAREADQPAKVSELPATMANASDSAGTLAVSAPAKSQPQATDLQEPAIMKKDTVAAAENEKKLETREQVALTAAEQAIVTGVSPDAREESKVVPKVKEPDPANYARSTVRRKSESSTSQGFGLTFIDEYADGSKDTVNILIPNPGRIPTATAEDPKSDPRFLEITAGGDTAREAKPVVVGQQPSTEAVACVRATDNDFLKLQKKMMSGKNEDDMVDEAKKVFRTRCFTSAQLRTLSILFPADGGKYRFFDAAYTYVADRDNFPSLVSELKDQYYVNRFRAMLR